MSFFLFFFLIALDCLYARIRVCGILRLRDSLVIIRPFYEFRRWNDAIPIGEKKKSERCVPYAYPFPFPVFLRDRFRTLMNVLGDSIGAGLVYELSKKELEKMGNVNANGDVERPSSEIGMDAVESSKM